MWGNSIGELAVAVLADVLSLKEALTISINQANLVQDYVPKGLVAIMDQPEQYLAIPELAVTGLGKVFQVILHWRHLHSH